MKNAAFFLSILMITSINIQAQKQSWYKGNTHTHTNFSDGDTPIKEVVKWYNNHDYNFLSITDHNITSIPSEHMDMNKLREDFICIVGNEITSTVHFTALGVKNDFSVRSIMADHKTGKLKGYDLPGPDTTKIGLSQILINGMLEQGALVFINHPNFSRGISAEEMLTLKGVTAIELHNAHPSVYNFGNERHIPVEEKWDYLLSNGMRVYGVGSDDEHNIKEWGAEKANPGRSWIMVEANELSEDALLEAISNGNFYTSTGVDLLEYEVKDNSIRVKIDKKKTKNNLKKLMGNGLLSQNGKEGMKIEIITKGGKVIQSTDKSELEYQYEKINKYLRVRATWCVKDGDFYKTYYAWTQPVFFTSPSS